MSVEDVKDPVKLAETIRLLSIRVQELEARIPTEAVEFERNITGSAGVPVDHTFEHNLGTHVRWYVVYWNSTTNTVPVISYQATSTVNKLVLRSSQSGRIVLRLEPTQYGIT